MHSGQLLQSSCGLSYPVVEMTSSGLTHSQSDHLPPPLPEFLIGKVFKTRFLLNGTTEFLEKNFGLIDFDWDARTVHLQVLDEHSQTKLSHVLKLDDLTPKFEPSFDECIQYSSAVYTAPVGHVIAGLAVGLVAALLFGVGLGVHMWCTCRKARQKVDSKKQKKIK